MNIDYLDTCVHTEESDVQVQSSVDSALVQQEAAALEPTDGDHGYCDSVSVICEYLLYM